MLTNSIVFIFGNKNTFIMAAKTKPEMASVGKAIIHEAPVKYPGSLSKR